MKIIDILPNKSQLSGFLNMVQLKRFTGFSGEGNGQSESEKGSFFLRESMVLIGSGFDVIQYHAWQAGDEFFIILNSR